MEVMQFYRKPGEEIFKILLEWWMIDRWPLTGSSEGQCDILQTEIKSKSLYFILHRSERSSDGLRREACAKRCSRGVGKKKPVSIQ